MENFEYLEDVEFTYNVRFGKRGTHKGKYLCKLPNGRFAILLSGDTIVQAYLIRKDEEAKKKAIDECKRLMRTFKIKQKEL